MRKRVDERQKTSRRPQALVIVALLIVLGLGGWWIWPKATPSAGGTPKLALDRAEIDLGYLQFNRLANVAFTITNTGDGVLALQAGSVRVVQGC